MMNAKKLMLILLSAAMVLPLGACSETNPPDETTTLEESTEETTVLEESVETTVETETESVTEEESGDCGMPDEEPTESVSESESESETEKYLGVNILADPTFQNGFKLADVSGTTVKILPGRDGGVTAPAWSAAQWWCNYPLHEGTETVTDTAYSIKDASKELAVDWEKGALTLTLNASEEMTGPSTTKWPHLLVEQASPATPLKDAESVTATMTFTIAESTNKTDGALHAQYAWFIYVADLYPESEGYGNFLWFGLNIFHSQSITTSLYHAQDTAGGPGNYIYSLGTSSFLDKRMWIGKPMEIECDILPHIEAALEQAHREGFMLGTDLEDVSITGTNLGWEIFDRWDETVVIENLGVYVK